MNQQYQDPEVYDIVNDAATADQIAALERVTEHWGLDSGLWFEPACGSGRLLAAALRRGHEVTGFDGEAGMIEFARQRLGPGPRLEVADWEDFSSHFAPRCAAFSFNLINTIRHFDTDESLLRHLEEMSRVLESRGRYVIGLSLTDYESAEIEEDVWRGERDGTTVTEIVQGLPPEGDDRRETILTHLTIERPGREPEHRDDRYTLRTYSPEEWLDLLSRSALELDQIFDIFGEPIDEARAGYSMFGLRVRTDGSGH